MPYESNEEKSTILINKVMNVIIKTMAIPLIIKKHKAIKYGPL